MSTAQPQPAEATVYLQVRLNQRNLYRASDAQVVKLTQKRPARLEQGCIVVKVKLRIPVEGWAPFEPSTVIDVPADLIQVNDILAMVEDPSA